MIDFEHVVATDAKGKVYNIAVPWQYIEFALNNYRDPGIPVMTDGATTNVRAALLTFFCPLPFLIATQTLTA
jgi:hypothetical protein